MSVYQGLSVSPGIGVAPAFLLDVVDFEKQGGRVEPSQVPAEVERLQRACAGVLAALQANDSGTLYDALIRMLNDPLFRGSIIDFPLSGTFRSFFSIQWNFFKGVFHSMELFQGVFPVGKKDDDRPFGDVHVQYRPTFQA